MTNMQLLEAIGMLDEEIILDAEKETAAPRPTVLSQRWVRRVAALAASVCLLFGGVIVAQMGGLRIGKSDAAEEPAYTGAAGDSWIGTTAAATTAGLWTGEPQSSGELDGATEATVPATTQVYTTTTTPHVYATTTTAWTTTQAAPTTTKASTETTSVTPGVVVPSADLWVYSEDFNGYADTGLTTDISDILNWHQLTVAGDHAYSESDVAFAIRDGRLYFDNYDTAEDSFGDGTLSRGKDGYYAIDLLNDAYMKYIVAGKYTLQYDLEYTAAANVSRYAALITELSADRQCYNSFHLRIGGLADHQCHFYGAWKTYSAYDPATDLNPSADDPTGAEGTPLVKKLLGLDIAEVAERQNLAGVRLTVRLQWDAELGHHVYLKTADMAEFVKVSEPNLQAEAPKYVGWQGWAVGLKIGGAVEGYLDNIRIWCGWGDEPSADAKWYQPVE